MTLALWRSPLSHAIHRNRSLPNARYVQLATVRPNGTPANRTIVFRGFVADQFCQNRLLQNTLQFVTDNRSEKAIEINHQALGEVCWYFPKTREQFRLGGQLILITSESSGNNTSENIFEAAAAIQQAEKPDLPLQAVRSHLWQSLSDNARIQFAWPQPGQARAGAAAFQPDVPDKMQPISNFCALLLQPSFVEHLELRGDPQNRQHYYLDEHSQWQQKSVNP
ncbi:MAG: pyridoxamine 5'-phosphate oxidase family protein [Cyanobacteria bacterium P01_F01_bin.150]